MKKTLIATVTCFLLVTPLFAAETQAELQREAKIPMTKARATALHRVSHGKIESGELEREGGKLIYSFDVKNPKGVTEVNVDAMNGKVVAVHHESASKETAEKKQEASEKH
jgi:uncharacterized membrane protein YkoI